MYQMNTELIDTSKMNSLDMDINNNRQHNCSISLSTITTTDTEERVEDNMSLDELRACLNIEAANMKKKLQQKSDTNDKEARRIRRIQKREEKKRLKNMEYVNQWDTFLQDFHLLDSTATNSTGTQQLQIPKSDVAKVDDNSMPTQRSKRRRTISLSTLSKSLSIRQGRNRKKDSLSKSSKSIRDMLSFITGSTAKQ